MKIEHRITLFDKIVKGEKLTPYLVCSRGLDPFIVYGKYMDDAEDKAEKIIKGRGIEDESIAAEIEYITTFSDKTITVYQ